MNLSKWICVFALSLCAGIPEAHAAEDEPKLLNLYQYKPLYFLMGGQYTKIELSFKTQIWRKVPLYFGYTQLMMWDLFTHSPFFYDVNYNPLAFYRLSLDEKQDRWLDLIPYEHESNGKGGALERSWNRIGAAYHSKQMITDRMEIYWDLKAWIPLFTNPNNADIAQYRGIWEINVTLANFGGLFFDFDDLTFRLYPGGASLTNPLKGGQELTIRLRSAHRNFLPLVVGQVFHGYGEYLQDYQHEQWGVRAGFGF